MKIKYPKGIKAVYDDGKSIDRYTVYFSNRKAWGWRDNNGTWPCVAMNAQPFHPQGFGQHSTGMLGRHNGKRITFESLPVDCKKLVLSDLQ